MDLFAHQTNVNVQNHCICFNTVKLGKSMQSIGMLTVLDQVWNRITRNRVLGRRTWVFTDEFQQLLGNKDCTDFYFQLSSRARKWGAIPDSPSPSTYVRCWTTRTRAECCPTAGTLNC